MGDPQRSTATPTAPKGLSRDLSFKVTHPKTYIDSGYSFNLGYAFPTALGAKVAKPDRPVVCIVGDGGFMFNSSELSTDAFRHTTTTPQRQFVIN